MKVVIQRTKAASVTIDNEIVGEIDFGYMILVGITHEDTKVDADYLANKIVNMRIFEDDDGKMNLSLIDVGGQILSVSQFTLYSDASKGRRPSFTNAARPDVAEELYDYFNERLRSYYVAVETGKFGANMDVSLINDGPVTLILESK